MNKKKISKIISSALSIMYLSNSAPVFAQDITINESNIVVDDNLEKVLDSNNVEMELDNKNDELTNNVDAIEIDKDIKCEENDSNILDIDNKDNNNETINENDTIDKVELEDSNVCDENSVDKNNSVNTLESVINENSEYEMENVVELTDTIDFKDENLQYAINRALSRAVDTPIVISDINSLTSLNLSSSNISDLSGLEYATSLTNLNISDNNIDSLQPIAKLTKLNVLNVSKNKGAINISEFKSLSSLPNLNTLILPIKDANNDLVFDGNNEFPSLQILDLSGSLINNLKITNNNILETLNINNSNVNDLLLENLNIISSINALESNINDLCVNNIAAKNLDFSSSICNDINIFDCNEKIYINLKNIDTNNVTINDLINSSNIVMNNSNINKVSMFNVTSVNCMYFDDANIDELLFENNHISYVSLQRGVYEKVSILNVDTLATIYFNDSEINDLNLKQLPKLDSIYAYNLKTSVLDLSDNCSLNSLSANNMILDELIVKDISNVNYLYITGSEINKFVLENLPKLSFVEASRLSGYCDIYINNCENINTFSSDSSELKNINIYNSFNNGYFSSMNSTIENFNCSKSKIQQISINNMVGKNILFSELETLTYLNAKMISIESFVCTDSKIEYVYFDYNARVGNLEFIDSTVVKTATFDNITADIIRCENTLIDKVYLNSANVKEFYMNNGITLGTISLDNGKFESVYVTNAPNAYGLSTTGIKVKNIVLDGFDSVSSLDLSSADIETLNLTGFNSLMLINISNNKLTNVNCLGGIASLYNIKASNNKIENIDCIKDLPNLLAIDFNNNNISNIDELKSMTKLEIVKLDNNKIKDISALSNCINLKPEKLSALNQVIDLPEVYSKGGLVTINHPDVIDIDGNKASIASVSNSGAIGSDFIAWKYDSDGILTEQIETSSVNNNFSVIANQKIIVDGTAPELNVSVDTTEFTNKDVVVTITASDELSGLDGIYLPDGSVVRMDNTRTSEKEITFNINKNGEYTFIAKDKVGNTTEKTIIVKNIDKEKPVVSINKVNELSNKKQFVVNIMATDKLSGVKAITLPDGTIISDTYTAYTFTENGSYEVLVEDFAGNITTETIEVKGLSNTVENNNDSNSVDSEHSNMPSTGGLAGVTSLASVLSTILGVFMINRRKK